MTLLPRLLYKLNLLYWKILKPTTVGVRILLIKEGEIVLVKHTYQDCWYLPGGGVKKGETIEEAVKREVNEELSGEIHLMELLGAYSSFFEGKNDHIVVFLSEDFSVGEKSSGEIEEVKTFPIGDLPDNVSPGSKRRIDEFLRRNEKVSFGKW